MAEVFVASEIVELGVQIEINGRDFYTALAEKAKNQKAREMFRYLAGEEEKHIAKFQEILDSVHRYEPKEAYPEEYFAYMNSLASNQVFTQKEKGREVAKNIKNEEEAIGLGIGFEKDSITFYEGMKKVVPEGEQGIVDELIKEEKDHLKELTGLGPALKTA